MSLAALPLALALVALLPGEPAAKPAIPPDPFPDTLSAFVWRNWSVVPVERLARTVNARPEDLARLADEMGLPVPQPAVSPLWRRKGYITILRRNWHLLPYDQLTTVLDMSRDELAFSLKEDDFLFVKLGSVKPKCAPLLWPAGTTNEAPRAARREIARILRDEGLATDAPEEPRFAFRDDLARLETNRPPRPATPSAFRNRALFSYCADYGDPLMDPAVATYPEGLLQKMAAVGINTIWLHIVLWQLVTDPAAPELGKGAPERLRNLQTLVARAARHGIRVQLYFNEPRALPEAFFAASPERAALRGAKGYQGYSICLSTEGGRRFFREAIENLFRQVPGLAGLSVCSASENQTNCASHPDQLETCPHCRGKSRREILASTVALIAETVHAAEPTATTKISTWGWPAEDVSWILGHLPKAGVSVGATSEGGLEISRGGITSTVGEYAISAERPSPRSLNRWREARELGLGACAATLTGGSWEFSVIPALPVLDCLAEHAFALKEAHVNDVQLSWSVGCYPSANQLVFTRMTRETPSPDAILDAVARETWGERAAPAVRRAWSAFSNGFREYPFHVTVVYRAPIHMGPANPLYRTKTGWEATMVGFPYDDIDHWCAIYPKDVWIAQMDRVADGFARGCAEWETAVAALEGPARTRAARELGTYRAATLHFRSAADQARFILARDRGDTAAMRRIVAREIETAKEILPLVRADSRIGYECSNHYFYLPADLLEKVICLRRMDAWLTARGREIQKSGNAARAGRD